MFFILHPTVSIYQKQSSENLITFWSTWTFNGKREGLPFYTMYKPQWCRSSKARRGGRDCSAVPAPMLSSLCCFSAKDSSYNCWHSVFIIIALSAPRSGSIKLAYQLQTYILFKPGNHEECRTRILQHKSSFLNLNKIISPNFPAQNPSFHSRCTPRIIRCLNSITAGFLNNEEITWVQFDSNIQHQFSLKLYWTTKWNFCQRSERAKCPCSLGRWFNYDQNATAYVDFIVSGCVRLNKVNHF